MREQQLDRGAGIGDPDRPVGVADGSGRRAPEQPVEHRPDLIAGRRQRGVDLPVGQGVGEGGASPAG
ncbi:hypothetical protein GCM10027613_30130 [Microlunatus endophyticus]